MLVDPRPVAVGVFVFLPLYITKNVTKTLLFVTQKRQTEFSFKKIEKKTDFPIDKQKNLLYYIDKQKKLFN